MLWLHSAAWIALLTFVAEQANFAGTAPLVFEVAGSRVADVVKAMVKSVRRVERCMIIVLIFLRRYD